MFSPSLVGWPADRYVSKCPPELYGLTWDNTVPFRFALAGWSLKMSE